MKLGYELKTGEPVDVPVTHTVVSALTGGGKTTTVRRLMDGAARDEGYTILAIDVKKERDFVGAGREIPPYISESTEPLLVMRMLESILRHGLVGKFDVILGAAADTENLEAFRENLRRVEADKKAWARNRADARVLGHLTDKLLEQVRKAEYAPGVDLKPGINVMNISYLSRGVQQLVVDSVFRWLLEREHRVVLVLEEAINFLPQSQKTEFEWDTSPHKFIREGRASELWLWASGQALTEMAVGVRKQMRVWVLGPQMEINEAKKFMEQIPMEGVKPVEIQKQRTGHFIAAIRRSDEEGGEVVVRRTYVQPVWMPDGMAVQMARGEITLKDAMKFKNGMEKGKVRDVDDKERKRYEEEIATLKRDYETVEHRRAALEREVQDLRREVEKWKAEIPKRVEAAGALGELKQVVRTAPSLPVQEEARPRDVRHGAIRTEQGFQLDPEYVTAFRDALLADPQFRAVMKGGVIEVPAKRVILSAFLEGHIQRIKGPLVKLPVRAKQFLAFVSTKEGWVSAKQSAIALFGYASDYLTVVKAVAATGAVEYDSQHGKARYVLPETLKASLQGTYEISDEELANIHVALQHEFLDMIKKGAGE